uniref:Uncharacterized protein n=1 Tax=Wuchereria bancrofti TaxID=6293 RepID=A0AAF5PKP5_WUCBA
MVSILRRFLFFYLYIVSVLLCIPLSVVIWWLRRKFDEDSVAGDKQIGYYQSNENKSSTYIFKNSSSSYSTVPVPKITSVLMCKVELFR